MTRIDPTVFGVDEEPDYGEIARQVTDGLSHAEMLVLAGATMRAHAEVTPTSIADGAPKTSDELWEYIHKTWNLKIARVAVCPGHDAPFDFICFGFFELVPNLFCIGPRGGGKSFDTACLIELNSRFKAFCESMVFGAVDEQNQKVYRDMVERFVDGGLPPGETELAGEPRVALTTFKSGARVNSYPATVAKMNGQHPPKAHGEEIEIMKPEPFRESRNMAADKMLPDGTVIKAQNFGTSTRKYKNGRVDKLYQTFLKAKAAAWEKLGRDAPEEVVRELICMTSPWYCVIYCIFEICAQVENCRSAPDTEGLPEDQLCKCNQVINGEWDDGKPRTLESVCRGRLYRSRGHRSYGEVIQLFLQNDRSIWEAQQECIEAESEGLYVKSFSRNRHGLTRFVLDPANGPIYTGTDWGFTDDAFVLWVQYLERPVEAMGYDGRVRELPAGSRVVFAEVSIAGKTATELGRIAIVREVKLATPLSATRIPVRKRWADLQGAGDIADWRKLGLKIGKYSTRNFEEHVREVRGMYDSGRAFVVVDKDDHTGMGCPEYCDQIESWRKDENGKESRDYPQHGPSAGRYVFYGMHDEYNDSGALVADKEEAAVLADAATSSGPGARAHAAPGRPGVLPALVTATGGYPGARRSSLGPDLDAPPQEDWRSALGAPAGR